MIKIIDNRKLELTQDEYDMYVKICRSYDRPNFKGEELFKGLFETDNNGIILFLIPPSVRQTSFEVFLFLVSIMNAQHLRIMRSQVDKLCEEVRSLKKEVHN